MKKRNLTPPFANQKTHKHFIHNDVREDEFFWLNERKNKEVIKYLEKENEYYFKKTFHLKSFQESLFKEMKSRIKEEDSSVPYYYNGYWYITRFERGKGYPVYTRRKKSLKSKEEILFDCNKLSKKYDYFNLKGINISYDNSKVSYSIDTLSRREYTIKVKELKTNKILKTSIKRTTGSSVWAKDNRFLFYTMKNTNTLRSDSIYRHDILNPKNKDVLVYKEEDDTFSVNVSLSKSEEYIFINAFSSLTTESRYIKANSPLDEFKIFQKRKREIEYSVFHYGENFFILTNVDKSMNYKIMKTSIHRTEKCYWREFIKHRKDFLIEDIDIFKDFFVLSERINGLTKIRVSSWDKKNKYYLPLDGETYNVSTSTNIEFDTSKLRYTFNSLTNPNSVIEFNMKTKKRKVLKEQKVLGGFNKTNYISKRIWAEAHDKVKIPISLVYHKKTKLSKNTPLLLYSYGSYGYTIDPSFSSFRLSILNRGFIFAIAHVRGGEYLGKKWYNDGKLLKKKNTFKDFISCSKHLINLNLTSRNHLYAYGGSAGGLLMGVISNTAPYLYKGIIAAVPFVDVLTTMLDESIPLTTSEYDEWGNPNKIKYYKYIKSYSPYDNVQKQDYPNMLITSGFYDSQVQYWEPAKWVSRLRKLKSEKNVLFFYIDMKVGHGGPSGRFDYIKEIAKEYSFLLELEKINK